MWSYYGSKTNLVDYYPAPRHNKIIEPFAGSAKYSLKYFDLDVVLIDKYDVVVNIWKWLQQCSRNDILTLPIPGPNQSTHDLIYDCEEAKNLVGFVIGYAGFQPHRKVSKHYLLSRPNGIKYQLQRIANDLFKIRHWVINYGDFTDLPNQEATWFIDPPYQFGGHKYVFSNSGIDYDKLKQWSQERMGQVIICETMKADWMLFSPLVRQKTRNGANIEAIWTNQPTAYDNIQTQLIL